jgi:hypothetical protein
VYTPSEWLDIRDIEMASTPWLNNVISQQSGPWPGDIPLPFGGANFFCGTGIRVINCVLHAGSEGISCWQEVTNFEAYGNLIYGCGWEAPDRGHGHCIYTQNGDPNGKFYRDNYLSTRYPAGQQTIQAYGSGDANTSHFWVEDNIATDGGQFLVGGGGPSDDNHLLGNILNGCAMWAGYSFSAYNLRYEVRDNWVVNESINYWRIQNLTASNNTVINGTINLYPYPATPNGVVTQGSPVPSQPTIFLKPNAYDPARAHLVIFNWHNATSVPVNFGGLVASGGPFRLMDPKNFYGTPLFQGYADATGSANVPTVDANHNPTLFNVFVVLAGALGNMAPQANAGLDQSVTPPANTATLTGTVTDDGLPTGAVVTHTWSQVSGPAATIANPSALSTLVTLSGGPGIYVFRLSASDTALSSYDDCQVTLIGNRPPVVSAGADQHVSLPATTATLAGTVSDDGLPPPGTVTLAWTLQSGPGTVSFANAAAAATTATFSTTGTYVLRLTASDSILQGYAQCTITVQPPGFGEQPFAGVPWLLPCRIEAENYDLGGQNVAYYDTTPGNSGGAYRTDDVDIRVTTDVRGGYLAKDIVAGEWLKYTVNVPCLGVYSISVRTAGTNTGKYLHIECDGNDVTGHINLPATADWDNGVTTTAPNCVLPAGIHILRVYFDTNEFNFNWFQIATVNAAPAASAGPNLKVMISNALTLAGSISDDGHPSPPAACSAAWSKLSGPGTVTFTNPAAALTTATFSTAGTYMLQLTANDSQFSSTSTTTVTVLAPGDFNGDGLVNGADFLIWQQHYPMLSGAAVSDGDATGDGKVDGQDFLVWQQNYKPMP